MNPVDPTRRTSVLFWFFCAVSLDLRVLAAAAFVCLPVLCWPAAVVPFWAAGFCVVACSADAALIGTTDVAKVASTAMRTAAMHEARRQKTSASLTMKRDAVGGLNTSS